MNLIGAALTACLAVFGLALPADADQGPAQPPVFKPRSETAAAAWSFFGTAAAWSLFLIFSNENARSNGANWFLYLSIAALPFGPSLGHFYAGEAKRAWRGIGIRAAAMAAFAGGAVMAFDEEHDPSGALCLGLILGGATVLLGSTLADIVDARESARKHNLKGQGLTVTLAPIVSPRSKAVGVQAQIRF